MAATHPQVVVGLLVYNGEKYLAETIESILAQTLTDFTLVIGDNASTDSTEEICRRYAAQDRRIVYQRHPENVGASGNHNLVFQPGDAPYFKWASHDDLLAPDYLRQCIELLEDNPSVGVAHCRSYQIDEEGHLLGNLDYEVRLTSSSPSQRLWRMLWAGYLPEVHGVMRSHLVKKTKLFRGFPGDDRSFLSEMLMQSDVGYVEDYLFSRRDHADSFCRIADQTSRQSFYNPKAKRSARMVGLIKLREYVLDVLRHPMSAAERLACLKIVVEWGIRRGLEMVTNSGEKFGQQLREEFSLSQSMNPHESETSSEQCY
ncbi:glycosyltransferase family 2 protein [Leptolyngbya sp. CCY15150]|uniref:glycosyltransferase family 2 protein n=1 Tax=Leptolyngbya sp. CCY15150 TaxID=2767772 RepID=UPI00194F2648|nr:glycosyltransferase family 2 protein [Leptolyngbya sp. CCY15150]